ncbi:MAG: protein kinase [Deltaproteobacteria bacterium]|nr:protein kinase [Deltaproteobacteria bacterium]
MVPPCPDSSVLEGFLAGALSREQRAGLESHLDSCPQCSSTVAELARLFGSASWGGPALGRGPTLGPPPHSLQATPSHLAATVGEGADATPPPQGPDTVAVGRYRLGRRIGAGGMGMVFEAHDPELDRRVAIKLLHPGVTGDADVTRARLVREARAMARLAHPNVVAVHDVGRVGEQVFLAMELVEGSTLSQWCTTEPRTQRQILEVFVQAGRGLEAAHAVGLVHRDFKPDNVLMGADGRVRVTDFGLARSTVTWAPEHSPTTTLPPGTGSLGGTTYGATAQGALVGTPAYMAPEQWRGAAADARSDQFSFCVALYEALFSARPFAGTNLHQLADNVLAGRVAPPPRSAPTWLRNALARGLTVDPQGRHPSMTGLLQLLERDRGRALRVTAIVGAMALGAAATVGTLAWMTDMTISTEPAPSSQAAAAVDDQARPTPDPTPPPQADPRQACLERNLHAQGRWTPERRTAFRDHIHTLEDGEDQATRVVATIDAWAKAWTEAAAPLCTTDPPPSHAAARQQCTRGQLAHLDALLVHASEKDAHRVRHSIAAAAHRLPSPRTCTDEAWLAVAPAQATGKLAARSQLLANDLASAQVLAALDQWVAAPEAAQRVAERAESLGHAPLWAEVQLANGTIALGRGEPDLALEWLEGAAATAQGGVHERVLAEAAVALIEVQGVHRLRPADAERWLRIVASTAERMNDGRLEAQRTLARGRVLLARGELLEARDEVHAAIAALREHFGEQSPSVAMVHLDLSAIELQLGDVEQARKEATTARTMLHQAVGTTDLQCVAAESAVARAQLAAGAHGAAIETADRAMHIPFIGTSYRHDLDRGLAAGLLGSIHWAAGSATKALEAYDDAEVALYADAPKALPDLWRGDVLIRSGRHEQGLPLLDRALAHLEASYGSDDPRLIASLSQIGRAQLHAGKITDARATLERAVTLADDAFGLSPRRAHAQIDLAELEHSDGNDARALKLRDDAHLGLHSAYGLHHPKLTLSVLARADLAWTLGQTEYAQRLYGNIANDLVKHLGATDPRSVRAREREPEP